MENEAFVSCAEAERMTRGSALGRYLEEVVPAKKGAVRERNRVLMLQGRLLSQKKLAAIRGKDIDGLIKERTAGKLDLRIPRDRQGRSRQHSLSAVSPSFRALS